jgi:hypothetical protein
MGLASRQGREVFARWGGQTGSVNNIMAAAPCDQNAALNILAAGTSAAGLEDVRRHYVAAVSASPQESSNFSR